MSINYSEDDLDRTRKPPPSYSNSIINNNDDEDEDEESLIPKPTTHHKSINSFSTKFTKDPKQQAKAINIMVLTVFLQSIGFTLMMPSMYDYLVSIDAAQGSYYGWVVALYSAGQFTSSPLFGFWSNKRPAREPLIVSIAISIIGNILYSIVYRFGNTAIFFMALGRFIVGFGAGNVSVCRAYASEASDISNKTTTMAKMGAAQGAGFVLGPAIGFALAYVKFGIGNFKVNAYTAPGYLSVLTAIANILVLVFMFNNTRSKDFHSGEENQGLLASEKAEAEKNNAIGGGSNRSYGRYPNVSQKKSKLSCTQRFFKSNKNQKLAPVFISIILFAIVITIFAVFETIMTELTKAYYHWEVLGNGLILGGTGLLSVAVFAIISLPFIKKIDDRKTALFGFANLFIALLLLTNYGPPFHWEDGLPLWQFIIGSIFVSVGYPIASSLIYAIFSKVLNPKQQGTKMGWLTAGGSLARMIGPIWAQSIWNKSGGMVLFLVTAAVCLCGFILLFFTYKQLEPHPDYRIPIPDKTTSSAIPEDIKIDFSSVFDKKDVVLFIDEFDRLFTVDIQVRSQILGQLRTWKQSKEDLIIKSVVAIGTFKILFLNNTLERFYSPFNVIDQMPSRDFTQDEVSCLFKTFQDIKGVTVDKKIQINIFEITDGHAGLVNLCGRAIDESILSNHKEATFQDWTKLATGLITRLSLYPTTTRMMRNLRISSKECKKFLLKYVKSYPNPIPVNNDLNNLSEDTEYLISEGFLKPILAPGSTSSTFDSLRLKSPLIKYCILSMINELDRRNPPLKAFPEDNGVINIMELISTLVPTFDFRSEGKSTKNNRGQGEGSKNNVLLPSEAFYHFELVTTIKSWLPTINISPNVRTCITKKDRADIVLSIENRIYALELVAHTTIKDVTKHINRARRYKDSINATDSWVIHFTIGKESKKIKYPSSIPGVGVIHVWHDIQFQNFNYFLYPPQPEEIPSDVYMNQENDSDAQESEDDEEDEIEDDENDE
eukprot:gene1352-1707_t